MNMLLKRIAALFLIATFVAAVFVFALGALEGLPEAYAHGGEEHAAVEEAQAHLEGDSMTLEEVVRERNIDAVLWATLALEILVGIAVLGSAGGRVLRSHMRKILFGGIVLVTAAATIFMAGSTLYLNIVSVTGGPVHWHADFGIFSCGEELDLKDPEGFANKVGTSVFHEHGDFRIHVEGVVVEENEAHLGTFFEVIGGVLTQTTMAVPTNDGLHTVKNGDRCPGGERGTLQVFVWETDESGETWVARQRKLDNFSSYLMKPESLIPPGDCIIVEFGPEKERTDHICLQYEVSEGTGDMIIER